MKKAIKTRVFKIIFAIIFIVAVLLTIRFMNTSSEHYPKPWPDRDTMVNNLNKKGYDIVTSDIIDLNGETYEGERLSARKGKQFVEAFWCNESEAKNVIYEYCCGDAFDTERVLSPGNTVYCGTKKAMRLSGIERVDEQLVTLQAI